MNNSSVHKISKSTESLCRRMIMQMIKECVERHLVFSIKTEKTLHPVIILPLNVFFLELQQFISRGEVHIYATPTSKGIEISNWVDLEVNFYGMFYKLSKSKDFAVIAPLLRVKETGKLAFSIKMLGSELLSAFLPVRATSGNLDKNDDIVSSPFGLGLSLRGVMKDYTIREVEIVYPVIIKSTSQGKVDIRGSWSKFSSTGYIVMGFI